MTHKCVGKLTSIGSDNGLAPTRRQAIIWTNAGILLIGPLGTNFSEILIEIHTFSFKKMHLKMLSGKWRPFCLGLNVLTRKGLFWQTPWRIRSDVFTEGGTLDVVMTRGKMWPGFFYMTVKFYRNCAWWWISVGELSSLLVHYIYATCRRVLVVALLNRCPVIQSCDDFITNK